MRKANILLCGLIAALAPITLAAQTPVPLPVIGNLSSIIGNGQAYAGVAIQLQNCLSPVSIPGYSVIVQQGYQVRADPSGVVSSAVWPNDLIDCNGTTGNSQYQLSFVVNGAVQGTPQCYQVVSTQGSWNLNTQQPIACSQSPPNPQDLQVRNLNITGCFSYLGGGCATLLGVLYSTAAPTYACASTVNNGYFDISAALTLYQCSNVTGPYQWNSVGGGGGGSGCSPNTIANGCTGATSVGGADVNLAVPQSCVGAGDTVTAMLCSTAGTFTPIFPNTILFSPDVSSGNSPTLAINGGTAYPILDATGQPLVANELAAGGGYLLTKIGAGIHQAYQLASVSVNQIGGGGTGASTAAAAMANMLSNPAAGTYDLNCTSTTNCVPAAAGGGGAGVSTVPRANPASMSGLIQSYDPISSVTPVCDIRTQGAVINGSAAIDSAVQACVNLVNSQYGATGTVLLPCVKQNSTGPGCYWANPGALTAPASGSVDLLIQGTVQCGSTCTMPGFVQNIRGNSGGNILQFQTNAAAASLSGPQAYGTLGTAITAVNTATNITPTFSGGAIANFPPGSALTIAAVTSSTATAVRCSGAACTDTGYGLVTLTTASAVRIPQGANITVSGCSDSSLNITNGKVSTADFPLKTITYFQTATTPTTGTGCTVSGFNDDSFESARVLCSNGAGGTFDGVTYASCGANQLTIMTKRTHLSTDLFGEVAAGPAFNTYGPQTWTDLSVLNCQGECFFAEGSTNLVMNNIGAQADATMTSGAAEFPANYISKIHGGFFQATLSGVAPGGGAAASSNPFALIFDSDGKVASYYAWTVSAGDATDIDQGVWIYGGIKIGDGTQQITGLPRLTSINSEEAWNSLITIDNRAGIMDNNCLTLKDPYMQDNISDAAINVFAFTDNEPPVGCFEIDNNTLAETPFLTNRYFNGALDVRGIALGQPISLPASLNGPSPTYHEGGLEKSEIENEGAGFEPQLATYGSLPMTSYSVAAWSTLCASAGCTATAVPGPDGPAGQSVAAEIDTTNYDAHIQIGTWTGSTYPGDHFIIGSWVRPGEYETLTNGIIGGSGGAGNSFYIYSGVENFAPTANTGGYTTYCAPGAFYTRLGNNGWGPEVAICTIATGDSTSHSINFYLAASNNTNAAGGNQAAEPFWAFIPGPNNPACTAAGTCNLSADQIEEARRDQYHGFVPPNTAAGVDTTGEPQVINTPTLASQVAFTYNGNPLTPGSSTTVVYGVSSAGKSLISEAGAAASEPCTAANGVCITSIPSQYKTWSCQDGIGGGTAAIATGSYATNQICLNKSGATWTIVGSTCSVDSGSGTTVTITDGSGNNLLASTLTCASGFATPIAPGATTTIPNGGYIKWTPNPDGTAKTASVTIYGTY